MEIDYGGSSFNSATLLFMRQSGKQISHRLILLGLLSALRVAAQNPEADPLGYYSQVGQKALAEGNYAQAETAYEKLRKLEPTVAEVHASLGLVYFQERKFSEAVAELRYALKLKPSLVQFESLLAMSLAESGQYKESVPGLDKCFRQSSDPVVKRLCGLQLQRAYTALDLDTKAVELALDLNKAYPNDPEILYHNARVFGNAAFLDIQKLSEVAPGSIWQHQAAAEAYESEGSTDSAIAEYRQVLVMDPRHPGIHYRIGRTLLARAATGKSQTDVLEAEKEFEAELQLDPGNGNAAYEIGEIHRSAGDLGGAQQYFQLALDQYPQFVEAHLGLSSVFLYEQKPALALPHAQAAVALDPGNEVAWYRLSQVEKQLGNVGEQNKAMAQFRQLHQAGLEKQAKKQMPAMSEVTKQVLDPEAKE